MVSSSTGSNSFMVSSSTGVLIEVTPMETGSEAVELLVSAMVGGSIFGGLIDVPDMTFDIFVGIPVGMLVATLVGIVVLGGILGGELGAATAFNKAESGFGGRTGGCVFLDPAVGLKVGAIEGVMVGCGVGAGVGGAGIKGTILAMADHAELKAFCIVSVKVPRVSESCKDRKVDE